LLLIENIENRKDMIDYLNIRWK